MNQVYNVAVHEQTTLNQLFYIIRDELARSFPTLTEQQPVYRDFRPGDVRHSLADISKAQKLLGYTPTHAVRDGLEEAMSWYIKDISAADQ